MNREWEAAKRRLCDEGFTCVMQHGETVYTSRLRGVRPLLEWLQSGTDVRGFAAADKVVGRATAFLYVLLGVRSLYAAVISSAALEVLHTHGVDVVFDEEVPFIRNRKGDGMCPFEEAVLSVREPTEAFAVICRRSAEMTERMKAVKDFQFALFRSVLEQDEAPVVICDLQSVIVYMNPAAVKRYHGDLTGRDLKACHNADSGEKIDRVLAWFAQSPAHNHVYTSRNDRENKDVYMVALRDEAGALIGYYEKHEYRNREEGALYGALTDDGK